MADGEEPNALAVIAAEEERDVEYEEDEEYVPPADDEPAGGSGGGASGQTQAQSIAATVQSTIRKRKVDEIWEQMKASEQSDVQARATKPVAGSRKRRKSGRKAQSVLASIFGPTQAREICRKAGAAEAARRVPGELSAGASVAQPIRVAKRVTVTEKARYAGKTVEVTRTVMSTSADATTHGTKPGGDTSLDAALSSLQGPKNMSTVAKSAADWEGFKDKTGGALKDDLEQAARNGYLTKQEFLERCDVRKFEQERDQRQAKRIKEGTATSA